MMQSRFTVLLYALVVGAVTTLVLWPIIRLSAGLHLLVFGVTAATAYGGLWHALRRAPGVSATRDLPGEPAAGTAGTENAEREITRLQAEIERWEKREAFRRDFVADVSHELKTPIFAAQGFVHTLLDGAVKDKSIRKKFLKKAARSLDDLDRLVEDLLTLSHIETGQTPMRFDYFDLYELTREVFDQFTGKSNRKEISLRIASPSKHVTVYADRQRIAQVLTNFVSNAIKHSFAQGQVVVSFEPEEAGVVVRVKDFGEGMSEEHVHRIFERFYRVDKSRSREKGGTGLGLAIVKHILEGHNTTTVVESAPGKGSTFSFRLAIGPKAAADGVQDRSAGD